MKSRLVRFPGQESTNWDYEKFSIKPYLWSRFTNSLFAPFTKKEISIIRVKFLAVKVPLYLNFDCKMIVRSFENIHSVIQI
jgi:hypothetical protein